MRTPRGPGAIVVLVITMLLAACVPFSGGGASATPPSRAESVPPTTAPALTSTADPTALATPKPVSVAELADVTDPIDVYGDQELAIVARVDGAGAMDPCPMNLEPAWFDYCRNGMVELWAPISAGGAVSGRLFGRTSGPPSATVWAVLHPTVEHLRAAVMGHVLTVIAHYDDPAARECHHTAWPPQYGPEPTIAETVRVCRSMLVITSFGDAP